MVSALFIPALLPCIYPIDAVPLTEKDAHAQAAKTIESVIAQLQALLKELQAAPASGCKGFPCDVGYHCEMTQKIVCVRAPCNFPKTPTCVPNGAMKPLDQ